MSRMMEIKMIMKRLIKQEFFGRQTVCLRYRSHHSTVRQLSLPHNAEKFTLYILRVSKGSLH